MTGASSGVGTAIARELAAGGHAVMVAKRDGGRTRGVAEGLAGEGTSVDAFVGDFRARARDPDEGRRQAAETIPLERVGTPEEIARLVVYLASAGAGFITGAAVPIDGGTTAR